MVQLIQSSHRGNDPGMHEGNELCILQRGWPLINDLILMASSIESEKPQWHCFQGIYQSLSVQIHRQCTMHLMWALVNASIL